MLRQSDISPPNVAKRQHQTSSAVISSVSDLVFRGQTDKGAGIQRTPAAEFDSPVLTLAGIIGRVTGNGVRQVTATERKITAAVSLKQRILADNIPPAAFQLMVSCMAAGCAVFVLDLSVVSLSDIYTVAMTGAVAVLAFAAGWLAAAVLAWPIFGPILYAQARTNGAPFAVGDTVQIISRRHRGAVSTVYAKSQFETSRVDLGEAAREAYTDIFADHQLLRVSKNAATEDES